MNVRRYKAVVFDLDDTLYPYAQYRASGFRVVSDYVKKIFGFSIRDDLEALQASGEQGDLFTLALQRHFKTVEPLLVQRMREIYRCHTPSIRLYPDSQIGLAFLSARCMPTGLVTDYYGHVQRCKVERLGLAPLIHSFVYSDDLGGPEYWKPSPAPFHIIALQLEVETHELVFVGDDPLLDFLAPRQLGMGAIRVVRPDTDSALRQAPTPLHEAHVTIPSLDVLWDALQMLERAAQVDGAPGTPALAAR